MPEGVIEFWAKLPQPHQRFGHGGGQPWFFNFECPELNYTHHFVFGFAFNDGTGGGGLVGRQHGLSFAATHRFGVTPTVAETRLLDDTPDGWHHYSIIWKRDEFEFPEGTGKVLLLTIDGNVVASGDSKYYGRNLFHARETEGKNIRLVIHDGNSDCTRPVAMSDLKIWDHAKLPRMNF
jgi:hypothetical protein